MPSKFDYLYNSTNRRVRQDLAGTLYIMRALKFKFTRFFGVFAYFGDRGRRFFSLLPRYRLHFVKKQAADLSKKRERRRAFFLNRKTISKMPTAVRALQSFNYVKVRRSGSFASLKAPLRAFPLSLRRNNFRSHTSAFRAKTISI